MSNATDTSFGFIANPDNTNVSGGPANWTGGMAISQKPLGISGYFKYNVASADSALVIVIARQGGATVGAYTYLLGGVHTSYTPFSFTFSPVLSVVPDSIVLAFASSNALTGQGIPGSTLLVDNVSFTGIATQPPHLNGDFELWQSQTLDKPNTWTQDSGGNGMNSVLKTTDSYSGSFALELQTYLGDRGGVPAASPGHVSTGYWDNSCGCRKGGYPFSNTVDTLAFYYKYNPVSGDSAGVDLQFKSAGIPVFTTGAMLHAASSYQYMEIPFSMGMAPDSVIVDIASSAWQDTAVTFVGSDLKIDKMYFKSQPISTGIGQFDMASQLRFYPNPFKTSGTFELNTNLNTDGMTLVIFDPSGRMIKEIKTTEHRFTIDRENMVNGIYFYELKTSDNKIARGKFVVN